MSNETQEIKVVKELIPQEAFEQIKKFMEHLLEANKIWRELSELVEGVNLTDVKWQP